MTTTTEPRDGHRIYPEGPPCQPNCPGPWSMYHDGYADGYERAENEAEALRDEVSAAHDHDCKDVADAQPASPLAEPWNEGGPR